MSGFRVSLAAVSDAKGATDHAAQQYDRITADARGSRRALTELVHGVQPLVAELGEQVAKTTQMAESTTPQPDHPLVAHTAFETSGRPHSNTTDHVGERSVLRDLAIDRFFAHADVLSGQQIGTLDADGEVSNAQTLGATFDFREGTGPGDQTFREPPQRPHSR